MPVEFLTAEQRSCCMWENHPQSNWLSIFISTTEIVLSRASAHAHTHLGRALQLCMVRFLGTFL